jgi:hypothetical protein
VTRALATLTRKGEPVELDPEKIKAEAVYKLLIGCVVPPHRLGVDRRRRRREERGPVQLLHYFHVRDDIYDPATGRLDMHRLRPIGRLAGNLYSHIHEIFEMKRPVDNYRG